MSLRAALPIAALAALASAGLFLVKGTFAQVAAPEKETPPAQTEPASQWRTIGEMQVTQGWLWGLFGDGPPRGTPEARRRPEESWWSGESGDRPPEASGTYRALCVRLCDGFPFPISQATTRNRFSANARQCEQACPGRSRLFVVRGSAEGPDDAVDLQGEPYRKLSTAFRYRNEYDASCTCRGNPWDEEALARHRAYAEAEKAGKTKPVAAVTERPSRPQAVSRREGRESRESRASRTARNSWQRDDDD
jgi:hypothetical protein